MSNPARKPKSKKADGTPKKRWSAAERAERGLGPRRSGGRPRSERGAAERSFGDRRNSSSRDSANSDRRDSRGDRYESRNDRNDRPQGDRWSRDSRDSRPGERSQRWSRDDRAGRGDRRDQRWSRDDRSTRDDRPARDDRWNRDDRDSRPRNDRRDDRRSDRFQDRRNDRFQDRRNDRGPDRRDDRDRRGPSGRDRFERSDRFEDRNRFDDRGDRRSFDDRPRGGERHRDRPSRHSSDRPHRSTYGHHRRDRDFRDDRNDRNFRDERGFRGDSDGRDDNADQMDWAAPEIDAEALAQADAAGETEGMSFGDLGVPHKLARALRAQGITSPFPIQQATIPDAISGRDVLGRGRTGSGKTLGFGLPMITRLTGRERIPNSPGAVVLVPTRELAMQVADVITPLAREVGLNAQLVAGGMAYAPQVRALDSGVDILVATPGRLIDLMNQGAADLSAVQITVLDEADHMADLGFLPDVKRVLDAVPNDGQRMLFSATLDRGVDGLVRSYLHDPVTHEVDGAQASVTTMTHHLVHIAPADKVTVTAEIANRKGRSVLFVRTQRGADRIAGQLRDAGVMAGALHGGLTQGARSRILAAFKSGTVPVLVATDVAARGIHVDEVGLVLQVDPPADPKDYLHRAGRTARAGEDGAVVTLVLPHQRRDAKRLVHQAGVSVAPFTAGPDDEYLYRATGARKPAGDPITEEAYAAVIAPPPSRPRRMGRGGGRPYQRRGRR